MSFSLGFTDLPADLRRRLLLGFSGRLHLHSIAAAALTHIERPGDIYSSIASDALLTAWGENPMDGNCVAALVSNMEKLPPLPQPLLPIIQAVLAHWQPEVTPEAQAAMAGGPDEQLAFLQARVRQAPGNLFWLHHIYEYCRINGDWKPLAKAMDQAADSEKQMGLFAYVLANGMMAAGDHLQAAGHYRASDLPLPIVQDRLAAAWVRSGKLEKAEALLRECVQRRPWNVGLWNRLHELNHVESGTPHPTGRTMVLGYSWNKAEDLAETLDSLQASDLGDVHVRILDNGSTDATSDVIRQFVDRFGGDKAKAVTMPVNVGAPAARNWLKSLPEVQAAEYVAYIDDDISLPKEWLTKLHGAAIRYPDAGVWGCKVVDFDGPSRVQCGEHNLMPTQEERQQALMSTIMLQDADFGQADYIRPCASVTGCVHLFKTERLLENGDFDLRFSPTQYDDLERDLRMVLGGEYAVYTGHLAIPHKRKSGSMSESGRPEAGGAAANMHKLMSKYSPEEFEEMAKTMDKVLLKDIQQKRNVLK